MKGTNFHRLKGKHLSVTLLVLTFTTIFLWAWEKNPFVTTLRSAQEQFNFHTSEFVVDTPKGSSFDSLTPNEHVQDSNPTRSEESQIPENEFDASNFTNSVVSQTEDGDAVRKPSSKIKVCC
uniref:Uncharacterized protein n=1 Tax=Salix viminalis TaxID=40686 RepID=A0A6N2KUH0_SALVM